MYCVAVSGEGGGEGVRVVTVGELVRVCVWGGRVGFEVLILSLVVVSCHLAVAMVKVRCVQQIKHLCSLCV